MMRTRPIMSNACTNSGPVLLVSLIFQVATAATVLAGASQDTPIETSTLLGRVTLAIGGVIVGFFAQWILTERRERFALRRSVARLRAEAYRALWPMCSQDFIEETRMDRAQRLRTWYGEGGGLFLSLAASERYFYARALLEQKNDLSEKQEEDLSKHLSWLRTQLKRHVGSYTWWEARTEIGDPTESVRVLRSSIRGRQAN